MGAVFGVDPSEAKVDVLVVEDSLVDHLLVEEAFKDSRVPYRLHFVKDGRSALDHLKAAAPLPRFVLLDLNLPRMNGFEVLQEIRSDPGLKMLPVFVLSSSTRSEDVARCYQLGANAYFTKPSRLEGYQELTAAIETLCHAKS